MYLRRPVIKKFGLRTACVKVAFLKKDFIYLLLEKRKGGRKTERETSMCEKYIDWLPLAHSQTGTWPSTQVCALTKN